VNKIDTTDKLAGWGEGRMDWRGFGQKGVLSKTLMKGTHMASIKVTRAKFCTAMDFSNRARSSVRAFTMGIIKCYFYLK
jgi:hypothetical protein